MSTTAAQLISFLLNPVFFLSIIPFFVVYKYTGNPLYALKWEAFSFAFIVFGLLLLLFGRWRQIFSDFDLSKREERSRFYVILLLLAFSYFSTSLFFKGIFFPLSVVSLGMVLGVLAFTLVNNYVKASIHAASSMAFIVTIGILYDLEFIMWSFWMIPLVGWSRLHLKRHTLAEVVTGSVLGLSITLVTFLIGKILFSI